MKKYLLCTAFILLITKSNAFIHPPGLNVSAWGTNTACTLANGSADATVTGGTPPYTYLWSTGATTQSISNLLPGTYTVTVHDGVGDSAAYSIGIISAQLDVANSYTYYGHFPCNNMCNAAVFIPDGYINGMPPYTILNDIGTLVPNSPAPGTTAIMGLCEYDVVNVNITDALGCPGFVSINGFTPPPIQNPTFIITPACNSLPNGSVDLSNLMSSPFDPQYRILDSIYSWDADYNFSPVLLSAGNYFLEVVHTAVWYYNGPCPQYFPFTIPDLGPTCSTVQGDVYLDMNANCTNDGGDINLPGTIIEFTPGPYYAYTNASGHYTTNLSWGNYNMAQYPSIPVTQLCPVANPYPVSLSSLNTNATVDFADTSTLAFDISAGISHGAAHPGFSFNYAVSMQNLSYIPSGMMTVTLDYDPLLSFVSANPAPFSTAAGQVVWQLSSITNFQSAGATVTLSVPPNPALLGDTLTASVNVSAATAEVNLANNTASTWHIITGSFDPNVKTVEEPAASFIPATDGLCNYTIQFQNTGNDTAFNVEVIDTLDSDFDVRTFVPGASSHPYTIDLTGQGVIHFYFNSIYLPDSTTDEPHSHGFVSFQINSKTNRPHGTVINNHSDIVFDFNPPVTTNTTQNTVDLTLAINASATTICVGQSVTLTMIPELQNTPWRWRTGTCTGGLVGTGNSITVSPTVTTTYFVRDSAGTIPTGACYRKTIVVNPLPTASITPSGPTTFCQGDSVLLTAGGTNNYLWSDNSTSQSISVSASGNYFVTVTDANNCSASTSVNVTVNPLPNASITPNGPTTFCAGDSVVLMAGGANSYLWSDNSTSQSISVSSSGNYFVTVTDANNCSVSTSVNVTVNPLPTASITPSGSTTFCQGGSVLLTAGGANNYLWSNSSTSQSITVSSPGNYSVTVADGNNCSASTSVTVTVNPLPNVSITPNGPTTFCAGNSVFLTAGGANNYLWSDNSTSQSISVSSSGNYFVTMTDANNCSASTSVNVTVNPLPTASITPNGPTIFCVGNSVFLTAGGANNYLWSDNSTSQSITVSSPGNYSVTVTDGNNCSASSSVSVTVNPNPPAPNITQVLDSLISDLSSGYQWYFNSNIIPGATSQAYHPAQGGNYSVVVTDVNGCTASSTGYPFFPTSTENISGEGDIFIYPNPVTGELTVQSLQFKVESVEIYDVMRGKIKTLTPGPSPSGEGNASIDVSELATGIYFVTVRDEKNNLVVRKIVKM